MISTVAEQAMGIIAESDMDFSLASFPLVDAFAGLGNLLVWRNQHHSLGCWVLEVLPRIIGGSNQRVLLMVESGLLEIIMNFAKGVTRDSAEFARTAQAMRGLGSSLPIDIPESGARD